MVGLGISEPSTVPPHMLMHFSSPPLHQSEPPPTARSCTAGDGEYTFLFRRWVLQVISFDGKDHRRGRTVHIIC